jgi:hypothetical protein
VKWFCSATAPHAFAMCLAVFFLFIAFFFLAFLYTLLGIWLCDPFQVPQLAKGIFSLSAIFLLF